MSVVIGIVIGVISFIVGLALGSLVTENNYLQKKEDEK
jgi:uncharacterized protein YneF (UPF0154 family)